jgi:subtilisin family serine protease
LLAQDLPFAAVTGSDSLDKLNTLLGVRGAQPLFFGQHGVSGDREAAYRGHLAAVRARFPARTLRAAPNASAPDLSNVFVVHINPDIDVERAAALYAADPAVEYAHPDYQVHAAFLPDDPFLTSSGTWGQTYGDLWGLSMTQAPAAWDIATGNGQVIAVVDTGVDYNHPDIAANMWTNPGEIPNNGIDDDNNGFVDDAIGWDFVDKDNTPYDLNGHGTHVAGTAAAVGNNGIGIAGMAWRARVMAVRGLDAKGLGWTSDLAAGMVYAAQNGADVINASWDGFSFGLALGLPSAVGDAVDTATALGVVVVAAAGNDDANIEFIEPAGYPKVITVAATDSTGARASFSNGGENLSVAAPGVDILSLRSSVSTFDPSFFPIIDSNYFRLSGTSMAAPHVSGLSALLLEAFPGLTPEEVRWHLELNADQPGYSGYEGQRWNPYYGWGRINAAQAFTPPPVTTRLKGAADLHAYADAAMPGMAYADFLFTTRDPVSWTLSTPSWLVPSTSAGADRADISLDLDTTGLSPGEYTDAVAVHAPDAVDGGASYPATLTVHTDPCVGQPLNVSDTVVYGGPVGVADGTGTFVVWVGPGSPPVLNGTWVDGTGKAPAPFWLAAGWGMDSPGVAFDGRNYLVAWNESWSTMHGTYPHNYWTQTYRLNVQRFAYGAAPLDPEPVTLLSHTDRGQSGILSVQVDFDGQAYVVLWGLVNSVTDRTSAFITRILPDGKIQRRRILVFPRAAPDNGRRYQGGAPLVACTPGNCLIIWGARDGELSPSGLYLDKVYGMFLKKSRLSGRVFRIRGDINLGAGPVQIATDGTDFLVMAGRITSCPGTTVCSTSSVATRVARDGTVLDPEGFDVLPGNLPIRSISFHGSTYVVTFIRELLGHSAQIFAKRIGSDGHLIEEEQPGLLLMPQSIGHMPPAMGCGVGATMVKTPRESLLIWSDFVNFDPASTAVTWTNPITVQRVMSHPPSYPSVPIGSIGARTVTVGSVLGFIITAPSFNPRTPTFLATGLPPGSQLDPSGIFYWKPTADEVGLYEGIRIQAGDGAGHYLSEYITITVQPA